MNFLASITLSDLILVCAITGICIVIMIIIILVSSKSPKKKKKDIKVLVTKADKEMPITNEDISVVSEKKKALKDMDSSLSEEKTINTEIKATNETTNIEDVLTKMEKEFESGSTKKNISFEEEQEEKAIISYKELLKVAGKLKEEIASNDDEFVEKEMVYKPIEKSKKTDSISEDERRFQNSEVISPVYGRIEKSSEQDEKSEDFLNSLKDLRKNLE